MTSRGLARAPTDRPASRAFASSAPLDGPANTVIASALPRIRLVCLFESEMVMSHSTCSITHRIRDPCELAIIFP